MKFSHLNTIFKLFLASACVLTSFVLPAQEFEDDYCCEEEHSQWSMVQTLPFLGGALVAGGAAIALTNRSHKGSTGPKGDAGGGPNFNTDSGEILVFNILDLDLNAIIDPPLSNLGDVVRLTIQPFVTLPNGETIEGEALPFTITPDSTGEFFTLTNANLGTLEVIGPVSGNYKVGAQVTNNTPGTDFFDIIVVLRVDVFASRDQSTTTVLERDLIFGNPDPVLSPDGQFQIVADYTYGSSIQ